MVGKGLQTATFTRAGQGGAVFLRLFLEGDMALSPYKGSFGGIETSGNPTEEQINAVLQEAEKQFIDWGCTSLRIVQPAQCLMPQTIVVEEMMISAGYEMRYTDLNYHIEVTQHLGFAARLSSRNKTKYSQCLRSGLQAAIDHKPNLAWYYDRIKEDRESKGRVLGQSLDAIKEMFEHFPYQYRVFTAYYQDAVVAFCVSVLTAQDVLYTLYPVTLPAYKDLNPQLFLHGVMYGWCLINRIDVLDLGTSTFRGEQNDGLARFKSEIGGVLTKKNAFEKKLRF